MQNQEILLHTTRSTISISNHRVTDQNMSKLEAAI